MLMVFHFFLQFYPYGYSQNDNTLSTFSGDSTSSQIDLAEDFVFYDQIIRSVYVCIYVCFP